MIEKDFVYGKEGLQARVTFRLPATMWTECIHLVGDFNNWNRTSHPLRQDRRGNWSLTLDLEADQTYQFRYLKDGAQWFNDDNADAYVYNDRGCSNSLLVTDPTFRRHQDGERAGYMSKVATASLASP